jgi:hypothetical protein
MTDKIEELTKQIDTLKEAVAFLLTRVDVDDRDPELEAHFEKIWGYSWMIYQGRDAEEEARAAEWADYLDQVYTEWVKTTYKIDHNGKKWQPPRYCWPPMPEVLRGTYYDD